MAYKLYYMPHTSTTLVKAVWSDEMDDLTPGTLHDYFGMKNLTEDKFFTIFGVYADLIKILKVNDELLHQCFLAGRLDDLIRTKYGSRTSGYYQDFLKKKIVIGNTSLNPTNNSFIIH